MTRTESLFQELVDYVALTVDGNPRDHAAELIKNIAHGETINADYVIMEVIMRWFDSLPCPSDDIDIQLVDDTLYRIA